MEDIVLNVKVEYDEISDEPLALLKKPPVETVLDVDEDVVESDEEQDEVYGGYGRRNGRFGAEEEEGLRRGWGEAEEELEEDEAQAFHYHLEAYRYFPVNMEVISWLGAYFVKNELYEKAMQFFERAAQIQPEEVKVRVRRSFQQCCLFSA